MIKRDKYVVMKRQHVPDSIMIQIDDLDLTIEDAVVIRKRDIFAEAGLRAYASAILTCIEILEAFPRSTKTKSLEHLVELADFINGEADDSRGRTHHIPD